MKFIIKYIVLAGCLSSLCNSVSAQTTGKQDSLLIKKEVEIPSLEVLLDSAMKNSASLRYRSLEINAKESNLISQKNYWLRNLGFQGDSRYGNIDALNTNANGASSNVLNTTSKQLTYSLGVYIKIPLHDIVNRKNQIRLAKVELEQAKTLVEAQQDEVRQQVIRQYQDVLLKQKLLNIKAQNLGSATLNMEMVEKEFRNGVLPLMEYVRIADMTARIQTDYELARSEFIVAKQILENTVGFTFTNAYQK